MTMQLENILQNEVLVNSSPNVQNYRIWQQPSVVQILNQEILQFSNRTNPHRRLRAMWTVEAQQDLINKETSRCDWKKEGF